MEGPSTYDSNHGTHMPCVLLGDKLCQQDMQRYLMSCVCTI